MTPNLIAPRAITVVDDVATRGDTLLAAASRVGEAYPGVELRAFAVVKTMGLVEDISRIPAPTTGTITYIGGQARREP